jgi:hypothetical protein
MTMTAAAEMTTAPARATVTPVREAAKADTSAAR